MPGNMYRLLFPFWLKVDLDPILHGLELDTLAQRKSGKTSQQHALAIRAHTGYIGATANLPDYREHRALRGPDYTEGDP